MLERELAAAPKRGSAMLRRVLAEVATGAESVPECEAAEILRSAGITGFQQNVVLYDRVGNAIGRGDIVWEEERAVLEIDSLQWHSGPAEWRHTMRRHNRLEEAGYAVLHYPPSDIRRDPAAFAESVQHWLAERMRLRAS